VAALLAARNDVLLFTKDVDETGLLFKGDDPAAVQEAAHQLAEQIALVLTPEPSLALAIGLGRPVERMAAIPHSFLEACDVARTDPQVGAELRRITYLPEPCWRSTPPPWITFTPWRVVEPESFLANHLSNTDSDA
jgi:hypothetical protein